MLCSRRVFAGSHFFSGSSFWILSADPRGAGEVICQRRKYANLAKFSLLRLSLPLSSMRCV